MMLLLPLAWPYEAAMWLRNKAFDRGLLKQRHPGVPVISVGNLTMGGTGKTPLVEMIVRHLQSRGKRVAIVSRGYKRKTKGVLVVSNGKGIMATTEEGGDEPVQMAKKLPGAIVVVGEKRVEAASRAVELGAEVVVLDDAFQHRYIARDLDIVVIDSTADIRHEAVVPAGRLRESVTGLRRAGIVMFSNAGLRSTDIAGQTAFVRRYFNGPIASFRHKVTGVRRASDNGSASIDIVRTMKLLAFSGIGNHDAFVDVLRDEHFNCVSDMRFADHHRFTATDVATLVAFAKAMDTDGFITTEKDIVRLGDSKELLRTLVSELPVFYLTIEAVVTEGEQLLLELINSCSGEN